MALEIFRLIGSVFVDTEKAEKSLKKTDKDAEGLGGRLLSVAKTAGKFAVGVVGAAGAAGTAMVALVENTREYRTEQGKLQTAFEAQSFSAETARSTYEALNGVLGDSGQAVEAANHLAMLADNEEQLATWTDICTGVYATFGDSLPIEGLTEAANETAKTGALTGGLADALNWAGVNEDAFQASLDACSTEQERQALITETLNGLYAESAEAYRENNAEVIAANEAQDKLNQSMASVGGVLEPFVTQGKLLIADVLEKAIPAIETLGSGLLPVLTSAITWAMDAVVALTPVLDWVIVNVIPFLVSGVQGVVNWLSSLTGKLSESGLSFQTIMTGIQTFFQKTMQVIQTVWNTVGLPVWNFIKQAVGLVAGYFQQKMPEIQAFVRSAFTDIQNIWKNNLQPALQAIGNFIQNVLAPAFKFVFNHVIAPVVNTVFHNIKQLWEGTLKPVFQGILDFITGVFTLNFSKAFSGLLSVLGGIWSGLGTVLKTPINVAIGIINSFISGLNKLSIPDWVPAVGGKGINIPLIPMLEEGGVLDKGQVGFLEGNGAEAVVPLHQNKQWIEAVARDMDTAMGGGSQVVAVLLDILQAVEDVASMGLYIDKKRLVGYMAKDMNRALGQLQIAEGRV